MVGLAESTGTIRCGYSYAPLKFVGQFLSDEGVSAGLVGAGQAAFLVEVPTMVVNVLVGAIGETDADTTGAEDAEETTDDTAEDTDEATLDAAEDADEAALEVAEALAERVEDGVALFGHDRS